jgi:hypothetical protein
MSPLLPFLSRKPPTAQEQQELRLDTFFDCLSPQEQKWFQNYWMDVFGSMVAYKKFKEDGDMSTIKHPIRQEIWLSLGKAPWWLKNSTGYVKNAKLYYTLVQDLHLPVGAPPHNVQILRKVKEIEAMEEMRTIARRLIAEVRNMDIKTS